MFYHEPLCSLLREPDSPSFARMTVAQPSSRTTRRVPASAPLLAAALFLAPAWSVQASQGAQASTPDAPAPGQPVVVYLVRHAEKADDGTNDPPLALAGEIRVRILQDLLADARLTHVHTTDWRRTRDTAEPIAQSAGLHLAVYDSGALDSLAHLLRATPGRHLVVGHSNTTPTLVAALGADPFGAIHEMEYNRLYIVTISPGAPAVVSLLRFGEPYVEGRDFGLRASSSLPRPENLPRSGN